MKAKNTSFTVKPFKNRNGAISFRVSGWLHGERVRKNFKAREEAIAERAALDLRLLQTQSNLRPASTFLSDTQLREAEAAFLRITGKRQTLAFYLDYALFNYREPERDKLLTDAVNSYLITRQAESTRGLITEKQYSTIKNELDRFVVLHPAKTLAQINTGAIADFIDRKKPALKTVNHRRAAFCTFFNHALRQDWVTANPVAKIQRHRIEHSRGTADTLTADQAAELMARVEAFEGGALVPFFALCLFAGIRPGVPDGEISRLAVSSVKLDTDSIHIEPEVSKVNMKRLVTIQPNLAAWLHAYPLDKYAIIPKGFAKRRQNFRETFALTHDVLRHTFISMHVAKFRSMGDTALQAGNSESVIRRHYLNVTSPQEADAFFALMPKIQSAAAATNKPQAGPKNTTPGMTQAVEVAQPAAAEHMACAV